MPKYSSRSRSRSPATGGATSRSSRHHRRDGDRYDEDDDYCKYPSYSINSSKWPPKCRQNSHYNLDSLDKRRKSHKSSKHHHHHKSSKHHHKHSHKHSHHNRGSSQSGHSDDDNNGRRERSRLDKHPSASNARQASGGSRFDLSGPPQSTSNLAQLTQVR